MAISKDLWARQCWVQIFLATTSHFISSKYGIEMILCSVKWNKMNDIAVDIASRQRTCLTIAARRKKNKLQQAINHNKRFAENRVQLFRTHIKINCMRSVKVRWLHVLHVVTIDFFLLSFWFLLLWCLLMLYRSL